MSETKHAPWKLEGAGLGARTNFVYEDGNLIGLFYKSLHADRCIQSVNARPKVEELVEAAKRAEKWLGWYYEMRDEAQPEKHPTWNQLQKAIREVEAALGGKAE